MLADILRESFSLRIRISFSYWTSCLLGEIDSFKLSQKQNFLLKLYYGETKKSCWNKLVTLILQVFHRSRYRTEPYLNQTLKTDFSKTTRQKL